MSNAKMVYMSCSTDIELGEAVDGCHAETDLIWRNVMELEAKIQQKIPIAEIAKLEILKDESGRIEASFTFRKKEINGPKA